MAIQTAGGAAGALIVEDSLSTGLPDEIASMEEQILLLQTIPFAALRGLESYSGGNLFKIVHGANQLPSDWENFTTENNQHGAATAGAPGQANLTDNLALVNGRLLPRLRAKVGKWYRWRVVHAGPFFFMDLSIEPVVSQHDRSHCTVELQLLAKDGIYLPQAPRSVQRLVLPPAGRADVAVRFACADDTKSRSMRLVSGARPGASGSWNGDLYWNPLIATIEIGDDGPAAKSMPESLLPFRPKFPHYLADLTQIPKSLIHDRFTLNFTDAAAVLRAPTAHDNEAPPTYALNGDDSGTCKFNGLFFNRTTPLRTLKRGTIQEWTGIGVQGHPLHLHVNPFQIISMSTVPGDKTDADEAVRPRNKSAVLDCDKEYGYVCVGDWHDTLQLPNPTAKSLAVFRFQTDTFTGDDVVHCHYLNHEDLGCISFVRIEA